MYLTHCAVRLRIEVMHLLMTACGIAFHSSTTILRNSRKGVLGFTRSATFFLMRAQTFSIGLRSGLFAGQFIRSMLSAFKKSSTTPAPIHKIFAVSAFVRSSPNTQTAIAWKIQNLDSFARIAWNCCEGME